MPYHKKKKKQKQKQKQDKNTQKHTTKNESITL